ncbi:MAG TPA: HAMP domain-containing sensor histidine kinase [Anaerolineae bacterium]|nr:HAMP domain-containing sensor histidine kinase [Anaerolineae bacterium]
MPSLNSWLQIQIQAVFFLFLALSLTGLILGLVVVNLRSRRRFRKLSARAELLQRKLADHEEREARFESVRQAYRNFVYNLSHEVANPLQSIQTNLDNMAACQVDEARRWRQYQATIAAEVQRMSSLTENLRLLAQLETPDAPLSQEPVNLKGVVEEVIMALHDAAEALGVRLRYVGPERPSRVLGDRDRLVQVLRNLVDNGIKYSRAEGGTVVVGVQEEGESLRLRVSDEGVGIAPEDLPHIFDTAYRVPDARSFRRKGSGLGLAIARRIVEQHGGEIRVQSQPGEGTTFTFSLPVYRAATPGERVTKRQQNGNSW